MTHFWVFLLGSIFYVSASSQVVSNPVPAPDQRRVDLRTALKVPMELAALDQAKPEKNAPPPRHLSDQERNKLREQLRRQAPDVKHGH